MSPTLSEMQCNVVMRLLDVWVTGCFFIDSHL